MKEENELLPCPFCGGEALRHTIGDEEPNNAGGDVITCSQCGASSHVEFGRKENLVSRWNTALRTPAVATGEGVTITRQAFDFLMGVDELEGEHFGDSHADYRGRFWWRSIIRAKHVIPSPPLPDNELSGGRK